ncbi:exopolysaccharide biosynthesis protein [Caenispirillum bisanense]|uniref:exopolysaccharide biosynthesis protein n=1 Tax=Caenispirillum bisanense TaxID=414052 RepID=UPI0031D2FA4F
MSPADPARPRRRLLPHLLSAVRCGERGGRVAVGTMLAELGDRSFGWALLVFGLLNLIPLPLGFNMATSLPVFLVAAQMVVGLDRLWLPQRLAVATVDRRALRRSVVKLKPIVRPIERIGRRSWLRLLRRPPDRLVGVALLVITFVLFLPLPLTGWFPAIAIFVIAVGLIEHDGLITAVGLAIGAFAVTVAAVMAVLLAAGVDRVF